MLIDNHLVKMENNEESNEVNDVVTEKVKNENFKKSGKYQRQEKTRPFSAQDIKTFSRANVEQLGFAKEFFTCVL